VFETIHLLKNKLALTENKNDIYKVGELIYDAQMYDGLNTFLTDLPFYKKWMPKNKDAKILELCCGSGRLTIPLAKEFNICGVDNSKSMLQKAKEKALKEDVSIEFIEADIRTLHLPTQFDLIFIPFNSIHHLYQNDDLFATLNVVKKHLKDDGLFLFDCFNPNIRFIVQNDNKLESIASYTTKDGRNVNIKQQMKYESKTQINRIQWHYFINNQFDSIQHLDMRMYFPQEIIAHLKFNGFEILHQFGSFDEDLLTDFSEKQIFVCKKCNEEKTL
jgi:ubiquinone/menaquinone biosynthesis C-methylase UbiE